tara:strand:+ start:282 stop:596 length:315 start_codon:yes stop_codon:yes gene_type:complete
MTKSKEYRSPIENLEGMTAGNYFFFQLGQTLAQAIAPDLAHLRFTLAAPTEGDRLLAEVAIELMMGRLGGTSAATISENISIKVGGQSTIRDVTKQPRQYPPLN